MAIGALLATAGTSLMSMLSQPGVQKGIGSLVSGFAGGFGAQPSFGLPAGKTYSVKRVKGRIVDLSTGRTIGYTPQTAKKKYRTKRRRKRLTKRDMVILATMERIAEKGGSPSSVMHVLGGT